MTPVLSLLASRWRDALLVVLAVVLVRACVARDHAIAERARAEERARVADSTIAALKPQLARIDTVVVRDTVRVRQTIARLDTLRDTVLARLTDTVVVREYVQASDSVVRACTSLLNDCAAQRALSAALIASLEAKLASQMPPPARAWMKPAAVGAVVGAGLAVVLRTVRR